MVSGLALSGDMWRLLNLKVIVIGDLPDEKKKLSRGEIYRRVNPISLSKTQADRGHQGWDASLSP